MLQLGFRLRSVLAAAVLLAATPAAAIGRFSSSLFKFAITVQDDGKEESGGWQEASAQLRFVDTRHLVPQIWTCSLMVGMPTRTALLGKITPDSAAEITASLATKSSGEVMHLQEEWMAAEFCIAFTLDMNRIFREQYKGLGARAYKA